MPSLCWLGGSASSATGSKCALGLLSLSAKEFFCPGFRYFRRKTWMIDDTNSRPAGFQDTHGRELRLLLEQILVGVRFRNERQSLKAGGLASQTACVLSSLSEPNDALISVKSICFRASTVSFDCAKALSQVCRFIRSARISNIALAETENGNQYAERSKQTP